MKLFSIRRSGCRKELYVTGRNILSWVDRSLALLDCWKRCRWLTDYVWLKQRQIELPADVQRYWTGRFEMPRIRLSDLFRYEGTGELLPFCESSLALYCKTKDPKYLQRFYPKAFDQGITSDDESSYIETEKRHTDRLYAEMERNGFKYDLSKMSIVVDSGNIILDGHHRAAVLYARYGETYEVTVVRII